MKVSITLLIGNIVITLTMFWATSSSNVTKMIVQSYLVFNNVLKTLAQKTLLCKASVMEQFILCNVFICYDIL